MDESNYYIFGRNPVIEALNSKAINLEKIFVMYSAKGEVIDRIFTSAKKKNIQCVKFDNRKFKELERKILPNGKNSQGVIALLRKYNYVELNELIKFSFEQTDKPTILVLDSITDPHNLGAIARTAECSGVSGIILSERDSVPVTPTAIKISAGALEHIPVCKVSNLVQAFEKLKENGFWLIGTDMDARLNYYDYNYNSPIVIVIGSEGKGIRPSTLKHCDTVVKIPILGKINSLNASVSAAILLYEIVRQERKDLNKKQ